MDIYTALCSKKDSDIAETYMTIKQTDSALALLVRPDDVSDNKEANPKFSKKEADYQQVHNEKQYFEAALGSLAGDLRKQAATPSVCVSTSQHQPTRIIGNRF